MIPCSSNENAVVFQGDFGKLPETFLLPRSRQTGRTSLKTVNDAPFSRRQSLEKGHSHAIAQLESFQHGQFRQVCLINPGWKNFQSA